MAKPKRLGKKYDSFNDKVKDYHKRKITWSLKDWKEQEPDRFRGEYNALTQLKSEIRNKIEMYLDGVILFSRIVQYGTIEHNPHEGAYEEVVKDPTLSYYPKLLKKEDGVRKKIENEVQEFISEIFNEDRMSKILFTIFFSDYKKSVDKEHEDYRIIMAELMLNYAIDTLQRHAESPMLFGELNKAKEIAALVRKQRML